MVKRHTKRSKSPYIHAKDNALALVKDAKISLHTKETNTSTVVATDSVVEKEDAHTPREVADVPAPVTGIKRVTHP